VSEQEWDDVQDDGKRTVRFSADDPNSPIVNAKTRELVAKTYRNGRSDATDAIVEVLMRFNSATRHPSVISAVRKAGEVS
jgi:hypothetical protein